MKKIAVCVSVVCSVFGSSAAWSQQTIQNPLVRPPGLGASPAGATAGESGNGGANSMGNGQAAANSGAAGGTVKTEELRERASSRLSQEDFNLRQQALNSSVVPTPLQNLFASMTAIATVSGQVVFRRLDLSTTAPQGVQQAVAAPAQGAATTNPQTPGLARANNAGGSLYNPALRMRLGKPINLNGYTVRARLDGLDVTVEWQDDKKEWITVFFGAVESISTPSSALTSIELEKIDTKGFDYLVPRVSSRIVSGTGGNQAGSGTNQPAGNFGNNGFGGAQNGQVGF